MTTLRRTQITVALALAALAGGECAMAEAPSRMNGDARVTMRAPYLLRTADAADPSLAPAEWRAIKRIIGYQSRRATQRRRDTSVLLSRRRASATSSTTRRRFC